MTFSDWIALASMWIGGLFFLAGTVGLLRFPDVYCRLHALTKADNVGLGLVLLGIAIHAWSLSVALRLLLIWALVVLASSAACHLTARAARRLGVRPWQRP